MANRERLISAWINLKLAQLYISNETNFGIQINALETTHYLRTAQVNLDAGENDAAGSLGNRVRELADALSESIFTGRAFVTVVVATQIERYADALVHIISEKTEPPKTKMGADLPEHE